MAKKEDVDWGNVLRFGTGILLLSACVDTAVTFQGKNLESAYAENSALSRDNAPSQDLELGINKFLESLSQSPSRETSETD